MTGRAPRMPRRRSRRTFVLTVGACWALALFGLPDGRVSALQLTLVAAAVLVFGWLAELRRRWIDRGRTRMIPASGTLPQTCVVVRRLGEVGEGVSLRWG